MRTDGKPSGTDFFTLPKLRRSNRMDDWAVQTSKVAVAGSEPVDREDIDVPAVMRNDISEHDAPFCSDS